MNPLLLVNFGGPRTLEEVEPFLSALLADQEMIRTPWPGFIHRWVFNRVAHSRAPELRRAYSTLGEGGCSPIYEDTQYLAERLSERLGVPVLAFHRYLEATHRDCFEQIIALQAQPLTLFPLFPHFSCATTGSIATLFARRLPRRVVESLAWVRSYPGHPRFISLWESRIRDALASLQVAEGRALLLFSAHGLPQRFIDEGDPYEKEIRESVNKIASLFPQALCRLSFQSKFGKETWLEPSTLEVCHSLAQERPREAVLVIPISFTSDHIETLYEIDQEYLPIIQGGGLRVRRLKAFNRDSDWIECIVEIIRDTKGTQTGALLRRNA